jgi:GNAT superfamily N-acetyltransferase
VDGEVTLDVVDAGSGMARDAMTQYFEELEDRFSEGFEDADALDDASRSFNPPMGLFLVAIVDGRPVGCGGVRFLDTATGEIKRMWVSPAGRGRGLGRRILARLEDEVRVTGRGRIVLDTNGSLTEAISLYRSQGYVAIPSYNDNPYADFWFEKSLIAER